MLLLLLLPCLAHGWGGVTWGGQAPGSAGPIGSTAPIGGMYAVRTKEGYVPTGVPTHGPLTSPRFASSKRIAPLPRQQQRPEQQVGHGLSPSSSIEQSWSEGAPQQQRQQRHAGAAQNEAAITDTKIVLPSGDPLGGGSATTHKPEEPYLKPKGSSSSSVAPLNKHLRPIQH